MKEAGYLGLVAVLMGVAYVAGFHNGAASCSPRRRRAVRFILFPQQEEPMEITLKAGESATYGVTAVDEFGNAAPFESASATSVDAEIGNPTFETNPDTGAVTLTIVAQGKAGETDLGLSADGQIGDGEAAFFSNVRLKVVPGNAKGFVLSPQ